VWCFSFSVSFSVSLLSPCCEDTAAPVISGVPTDVTVECNAVPPLATTVTAADLCSASPEVTSVEQRVNGTCPQRYQLRRSWTAVDTCGNSVQQTQTITVQVRQCKNKYIHTF
jgi:hypothetical protein